MSCNLDLLSREMAMKLHRALKIMKTIYNRLSNDNN
jgi:hypothetical protein